MLQSKLKNERLMERLCKGGTISQFTDIQFSVPFYGMKLKVPQAMESELRARTNLDLKPTLDTFSIQRLHDHSKIVKTLRGYCRGYDTLGISRH